MEEEEILVKNCELCKEEEIDPFISIDIKCQEHPKIPMNLFCLKEKSIIYII